MKHKSPLLLFFFFLAIFSASAQDNYLIAENSILRKGDKLNVHLLYGDEFRNDGEYKYDASITSKFMMYIDGKKTNLLIASKDSAAPVLSYLMNTQGLALIEMVRNIPVTAIDRDIYAKTLGDEGLTKLSETVNNSNQQRFREKKTCYLKTLVMVDKPSDGDFDKPLGEDYEIVLKTNPYKLNYGDDISGTLYLKGKPEKVAYMDLYIKASSGNIYTQRVSTDEKGNFSFIASREGMYLLRGARTIASTGNDVDFETTETAVTFLFNSTNDTPNSYREFGFGDKH